MISTRHALAFFVVLTLMLLGILLSMMFREEGEEQITVETASFEASEEEFKVTVYRSGKDDSIRESIIAKLGGTEASETEIENKEGEEVIVEEETDLNEIPPEGVLLGDGKLSTAPKAGHIYICQSGTGNAPANPSWVEGSVWFPNKKITVEGAVRWDANVSITNAEGARVILTNGLPNHTTGLYPVASDDAARQYDNTSNAISAQNMQVQLSQHPEVASVPGCVPIGMIGVGLNGVALYSGVNNDNQDAEAHEVLDHCGGHPDEDGIYHYHGQSECLINSFYEGAESTLLGYALDGFGIFSSIENGAVLTNDDLDSCHGHDHPIPWNGSIQTIYHYHMTDEYPYSVGCFMGNPTEVSEGVSAPLPPAIEPPEAETEVSTSTPL